MKGGNKKRECFGCGSSYSYYSKRDNCEVWFLNWDEERNALCRNCFRRYFEPDQTFRRRIKQNGKVRLVDQEPRTGYCQRCNNKTHDKSCKRTALLHGTLELCLSCFNKAKWKEGIIKPKKTAPRGPRMKTRDATRKKLSIAMTGKIFSEQHRAGIKVARARQVIPVIDTSIEKIIQNELDRIGIIYEKRKAFRVRNIIHPVDIFIEPNLCVECDGEYWHTKLIGRGPIPPIHRDYIIDCELENTGMKVIRLSSYDIKNNLAWCIKQILRYAVQYRKPVMS